MSIQSVTHSAPHTQPSSWAQRVRELMIRAVTRLAQEITIRRDLRYLSEMNDAMLRDIGITRGELEGAVRFGRAGRKPGPVPPIGSSRR